LKTLEKSDNITPALAIPADLAPMATRSLEAKILGKYPKTNRKSRYTDFTGA
jgi:hypothetical protein